MATTAKLVCKQCNFENEPERVYCHNCGAKLDRSLLPPEASRREDPVVMQERVRKMVSPKRGMGLRHVRSLLFSVIIASVLACLILIIKPPANVPVVSKEAALNAPAITDDLENLTATQPGRSLKYTEDLVNAFLQYSVRGQETSKLGTSMKFERAFVHFQEGRLSITSVQNLYGLQVYSTTVRTVQVQNGTLVSQVLGGSFGSLRIPGAAMPYLESVFNPLWKVLEHNRVLLAKLQSVTFHDKTVEMVSKAPGAR